MLIFVLYNPFGLTAELCVWHGRFIVGKEEIPTHSSLAELPSASRSERPALPPTGTEQPSSYGRTITALTRRLLDSL